MFYNDTLSSRFKRPQWSTVFCFTLMVVLSSIAGYTYLENYLREKEIKILKFQLESVSREVDALREVNEKLREFATELRKDNDLLIQQNKALLEFKDGLLSSIYKHMKTKDEVLAEYTLTASVKYSIPPLLLTALINTESAYKKVTHDLDYVIGYGGINTKYWKLDMSTDEKDIEAAAYVLRQLLNLSKGDYLEALHRYKGKSELGLRRARLVLDKFYRYQGNFITVLQSNKLKEIKELYAFENTER